MTEIINYKLWTMCMIQVEWNHEKNEEGKVTLVKM